MELSPEQMRALELGALLHDFGKTGVPSTSCRNRGASPRRSTRS